MVSLKRLENENSVHYSSAMDVYLKSNKTSTRDVQRKNKKLYVLLNSFTGIFKLNNKDKSKDVASIEICFFISDKKTDSIATQIAKNARENYVILEDFILNEGLVPVELHKNYIKIDLYNRSWLYKVSFLVGDKEVYLPIESITINTKNTFYLDNLGFSFS